MQPLDLAARLRILRTKADVANDYEFAKMAGVARSSMSLYLNGKQRPKTSTLHRLAKAMNVDSDWLLGTDPTKKLTSNPPDAMPSQHCALLTTAYLDSPVNFNLLSMALVLCQEYFKNEPKPTLRQVLDWIAGPYALHATIPDAPVKLSP